MDWGLLPLLNAPGHVQMAVDAWLLEQHRRGLVPSILRFYTWSPPAISLGYHQHRWPSHWSELGWKGQPIDLVRRPSGGRAVLHQGDLTYAVITSGLSGRRAEAYQFLCQFLIEAWRSLHITLQYGTAGRGYIHNPNCFGTATAADLVTPEGAKLIGSAQLRRGDAVLQHGSMRIAPDVALFRQVFATDLAVPDLSPAFSSSVSFSTKVSTVMGALIEAARHCFSGDISLWSISEADWQVIQEQASQWRVEVGDRPLANASPASLGEVATDFTFTNL